MSLHFCGETALYKAFLYTLRKFIYIIFGWFGLVEASKFKTETYTCWVMWIKIEVSRRVPQKPFAMLQRWRNLLSSAVVCLGTPTNSNDIDNDLLRNVGRTTATGSEDAEARSRPPRISLCPFLHRTMITASHWWTCDRCFTRTGRTAAAPRMMLLTLRASGNVLWCGTKEDDAPA